MKGMTIIVKKVSEILCGVIFLYGIYIVLHGHLTPGVGFAGGVIIAGAFILLIIANGSEKVSLKRKETGTSFTESGAILAFLAVAASGMVVGTVGLFFKNYLPKGHIGRLLSAGFIPVYNIVVGIEVSAALITVFLAFVIFREEVLK